MLRDIFLASIFVAYVEPKLFFTFARENSPVQPLTKFLLEVDWTTESKVVQAAELLGQWKKRSLIEVTDTLSYSSATSLSRLV